MVSRLFLEVKKPRHAAGGARELLR